MKNRIIALPEDLAAKIAAGEVVERPASVVKELVENAIDAGASKIEVELEDGGASLIRVIDDGGGIDADQVPLVFDRHATSKITSLDDLYRLNTLGFRGEAMYSIAAVSKMELLTRTRESTAGTRAVVEGGVIQEILEAGAPAGTSVRVVDLFHAVPARKKFLKKTASEQARCVEMVTRLALANHGIGFTLRAGGKVLINVQKSRSMTDRLYLLWGDDFRKNSLIIDQERGNIQLRGALSRPAFTRSSRKGITCFVNGRPLRDSLLNQAVMSAYRGLIEARRYPLAVLFLELPGAEVDVNVHPTKLEVRFRDERSVFSAVSSMIADELARSGITGYGQPEKASFFERGPQRNSSSHIGEAPRRYRLSTEQELFSYPLRGGDSIDRSFSKDHSAKLPSTEPIENRNAPAIGDGIAFSDCEYLGQVGGAYLVFSAGRSLLLIDQHAAHERIRFETLKASGRERSPHCQGLLIPEIITMTPGAFSLLMDLLPIMKEAGFDIEPYGANTVSVKAVPSLLGEVEIQGLIMDSIDEIETIGIRRGNYEEKREKIMALMACRGSVMAGQVLSDGEVKALCAELDRIPNAGTCPHGRPVFRVIDAFELERLFKRR